ncbi:reverse transcriptase domain-containing protein [Trichonephila clavipes]|nr:reverse transcriptase domain-containing protein [Trichonephila clavipes]
MLLLIVPPDRQSPDQGPRNSSWQRAGIEKTPPPGGKLRIFADYIIVWCSGSDVIEMETTLNKSLSAFASETKLCFNLSKSIVTFFTINKKLYNHQPKLKMNNQDCVREASKYLGYILDPKWASNKLIDHIVLRIRQRLKILKYIASKDWGAYAVTLRKTYMTLIRPILDYGFLVFSCASDTNLNKLEKNPTQCC